MASQQELEQPAKVYQLNAVESKVDQLLSEVQKISQNVSGVVTTAQQEVKLKETLEEAKAYTDTKVVEIDLKYGPTQKAAWWFAGIVMAGVVGQFVLIIFKPFG